jgi:hypothetical protein
VPNECTSLKHIIIFKKSRNIIFRIIDLGMSPVCSTAISNTDSNDLAWSNSKKPFARSAKCNACANSAATPSLKLMSRKRESYKRTTRHEKEGDMARWLVQGRRLVDDMVWYDWLCAWLFEPNYVRTRDCRRWECTAHSGSGWEGVLAFAAVLYKMGFLR